MPRTANGQQDKSCMGNTISVCPWITGVAYNFKEVFRLKTFIVKYIWDNRRIAVRVCAASYDRAVDTVMTMTRGRVYSVKEVIP